MALDNLAEGREPAPVRARFTCWRRRTRMLSTSSRSRGRPATHLWMVRSSGARRHHGPAPGNSTGPLAAGPPPRSPGSPGRWPGGHRPPSRRAPPGVGGQTPAPRSSLMKLAIPAAALSRLTGRSWRSWSRWPSAWPRAGVTGGRGAGPGWISRARCRASATAPTQGPGGPGPLPRDPLPRRPLIGQPAPHRLPLQLPSHQASPRRSAARPASRSGRARAEPDQIPQPPLTWMLVPVT